MSATTLPPMADVLRALWGTRSTRHLIIGMTLLLTMGLGLAPWYAAFMIRSHGMTIGSLGIWLALIFGAGGLVGTAHSDRPVEFDSADRDVGQGGGHDPDVEDDLGADDGMMPSQ